MTTPATTPPIVARCEYPHIFMQWHGDGPASFPLPESDVVTWCKAHINESDVEYVPITDLTAAQAEIARLRAALEGAVCSLSYFHNSEFWRGEHLRDLEFARAALNRTDNPAEAGVSGIVVKDCEVTP